MKIQTDTGTLPWRPPARPIPSSIIVNKMEPHATLLEKTNPHSAGFDLASLEDVTIAPHSIELMKTGIRAFPKARDVYLRITGRSGLTSQGYLVQTGVVDADYFGEIKVIMFNSTGDPVMFKRGSRIAQLVPEYYVSFCRLDVIDNSCFDAMTGRLMSNCHNIRGARGFGSSGV